MPESIDEESNTKFVEKFLKWKESNDSSIRNELLMELKPEFEKLVKKIMNQNKTRIPFADLLQEAFIGAIKGFNKYNPNKSPFVWYMKLWARAYILIEIKKSYFLRIGTTDDKRKAIVAIARDSFKYINNDGKEDLDTLAKVSNINIETLEEIKNALQTKIISTNDDESSEVVDNWISSTKSQISPEDLFSLKQQLILLYKVKDLQHKDIDEKIKTDRQNLYKDLLNLRILPEIGQPLTLEKVAHKNNFKDKQNVEPVEKKIIESIKKKYLLLSNTSPAIKL